MDHNQLRDSIRSFRFDDGHVPGNRGYKRVLLQLFGFVGHGKSDFINSCKYVLDGEYKAVAEAGEKHGGLTMVRRSYRLTDTITIVDNRGYNDINGFQALEIYAQLGNFFPLDVEVKWSEDHDTYMELIENSDQDEDLYADFIVPIFVYRITKVIHPNEEHEIKNFMKTCLEMAGVLPIVVLTYKTSGKYYEFEQRFGGYGAEGVFSLENYTEENHMATRGKHTDILKILEHAIQDIKFRMEQERNPTLERITRKKILLKTANRYDHEKRRREEEEEKRKEEDRKKQEKGVCTVL